MKTPQIPSTDSIEELARFWDTHDLTDFEDELEEVREPLLERRSEETVTIQLPTEVGRRPNVHDIQDEGGGTR